MSTRFATALRCMGAGQSFFPPALLIVYRKLVRQFLTPVPIGVSTGTLMSGLNVGALAGYHGA